MPFDSVLGAEAAAEALDARDFAGPPPPPGGRRALAAALARRPSRASPAAARAQPVDWGLADERDAPPTTAVERCRRGEVAGAVRNP